MSVILPVYNAAQVILRAVDSVLNQSYGPVEFIIVDDGSSDGTAEILTKYRSVATIRSQRNQGPECARNTGLALATGEIIGFIDSDDEWLPKKLELQVPLFERPEVGVVYGNGLIIDCRGGNQKPQRTFFSSCAPERGHVFPGLLRDNFVPQSSVLVRRRCFEDCGPFMIVPVVGDLHKWLQLAPRYEFDYVDAPVFKYHILADSISRYPTRKFAGFVEALENLLRVLPVEYRSLVSKRLYQAELELALARHFSGSCTYLPKLPERWWTPRRLRWAAELVSRRLSQYVYKHSLL